MKKILLAACILLLAVVSMNGCATVRKIDAASILRSMKVEFREIALDSVALDPNILQQLGGAIIGGLLPNPRVVALVQNIAKGNIEINLGSAYLGITLDVHNADKDTLWLRSFNADIALDTLMSLPLELKDSVMLAPGVNKVLLKAHFPLDNKIFKLKNLTGVTAKGQIVVALDSVGESVPFDFNIRRDIPHEELVALEDNVRQSVLNSILSDWVGAILPEDK